MRRGCWLLAAGGLFVFISIYFKLTGGSPQAIVQNPHYLLIMLSPFLPAAVMAYLSERLARQTLEKFEEMMKNQPN